VHHVVAQPRPGRQTKGVNRAHIAEYALAEVVDMAILHHVMMGGTLSIAPTPADGDTGVIKVANVAVADGVVTGPAYPDPVPGGKYMAAIVNPGVVHQNMLHSTGDVFRGTCFPDSDTACAQVVQMALFNLIVLGTLPKPQGISACMSNFTFFKGNITSAGEHYSSIILKSRTLSIVDSRFFHQPVGMLKR